MASIDITLNHSTVEYLMLVSSGQPMRKPVCLNYGLLPKYLSTPDKTFEKRPRKPLYHSLFIVVNPGFES